MKRIELSETEKEIFVYVRDYRRENGFAPSIREMAFWRDVSYKAVHETLIRIERKGWIKRTPGVPRGIKLI